MMRTPVLLALLGTAAIAPRASADTNGPLPNPDGRFRSGANHHTGDDGFAQAMGRAARADDPEHLRMKLHFLAVRQWLASRPPTKPELAGKRAEILAHLDAYIAKGTTPRNERMPWRTPVFIDGDHTICAVGYLIEQTAGRALPEKIAKEHRYEYIDDIAREMPEVGAWVEASGFTLEELSHIQPAYSSPTVETWRTWDLVHHAPKDGPFDDGRVTGTFDRHAMHGTWRVFDSKIDMTKGDGGQTERTLVGIGELRHGTGTWKSFYQDGTHLMATGPFRDNVADGAWTFYHPSGNVAARGQMVRGMRLGAWTFYYDTPAETPIMKGRFSRGGWDSGVWQHFDAEGKPLARTYSENGAMIDVTPDAHGVALQIHSLYEGDTQLGDGRTSRLDRLALGGERMYVFDSAYAKADVIYDGAGYRLERGEDGAWTAADCHWSAKRKHVAQGDNVAWLDEMLVKESHARRGKDDGNDRTDEGPACGAPVAVSAARAAHLDTMMASRKTVRAPTPAFVRKIVLGDQDADDGDATAATDASGDDDKNPLVIPYIQWAYVDGRFEQVFRSMAGRLKWEWYQSDNEPDGTNPNDKSGSPG